MKKPCRPKPYVQPSTPASPSKIASITTRLPVRVKGSTLARLKTIADLRRTDPLTVEKARLSLLSNHRELLRDMMAGEHLDYMPPWQEVAPDLFHTGFETPEACEREDAFRYLAAVRGSHFELARALAPRQGEPEPSLASARFGRLWRLRLIVAAQRLFLGRKCYFVTVIPPGWWVPVNGLQQLNPKKLMLVFKQQLARAGARDTDGKLFVKLEASLEVHALTGELGWQFHLHGVVTEEISPVLKGVGEVRALRPLHGIKQPIRNKTMCDHELSCVLGYSTKQKVNAGELVEVEHEGKRYCLNPRGRLPEPWHSEYLCWLRKWRPADLCLTMGSRDLRHPLRKTWV